MDLIYVLAHAVAGYAQALLTISYICSYIHSYIEMKNNDCTITKIVVV